MNKIKAALLRKFGPLPAWGWSLIALAGVYYWRHRNGAASQVATGTAAGVASGAGYGYGDTGAGGGGGGLPPDMQPLTAPPTQADGAPVSWDPVQAQAPTGAVIAPPAPTAAETVKSGPLPFALPGAGVKASQPLAPASNPLSVLNLTGGLSQPLLWGGKTFYTQTAFQAWARQHGTTVRAELTKHPEASRIYAQLIPADYTQTIVAPKTTKASTRTRTHTATPPPAPADRPVSVRGVPAPRVVSQPAAATKKKTAAASRSTPSSKAAAAFTHPIVPGLVQNPVTNPIRAAAPSRTLAVTAPAPAIAPNEGYALLNPQPAVRPQETRVTASAPPVLPTVAPVGSRVAPRAGTRIAE